MDPDLQAAIAIGPSQEVVTRVFDDKPHIVGFREFDTSLYVRWLRRVDSEQGVAAECAISRLLAGSDIDRWASDVGWIAQADGISGLEERIRPLFIDVGALCCILLGTRVARYGNRLGRDQATANSGVERCPRALGRPT